jgi:hypothetical protein
MTEILSSRTGTLGSMLVSSAPVVRGYLRCGPVARKATSHVSGGAQ